MWRRPAEDPWWVPLWLFAVHAATGTTIFVIIALPAIGLDFAVKFLGDEGVTRVILVGLMVAEFSLFFGDLALFLVFVLRAAFELLRSL